MVIAVICDLEVDAIVDLWRRCDLTRPWNDPWRDVNNARRTPDATVLVGRVEGALVASVMVGFDGHRGWVYYLAVDPGVRRRGLGRDMMEAAERWLRDRGAPKMQLMVRETNAAALGFYERLGLERQAVITLGKRLDEGAAAVKYDPR